MAREAIPRAAFLRSSGLQAGAERQGAALKKNFSLEARTT